jgi:hypothetical protein
MAGPYDGFGATLKIGATAIVAVRDISGPGVETDVINASTRDSRAKAFLPGMYDNGEITFDIAYDPDTATHGATGSGLVALQIAGTISSYVLTLSDTTPAVRTFNGFVKSFNLKTPMGDLMSADVTVKITGAITYT